MDPYLSPFRAPRTCATREAFRRAPVRPILHGGGALLPLREYEMGHEIEPDAPQAIITWPEEKMLSSLIA